MARAWPLSQPWPPRGAVLDEEALPVEGGVEGPVVEVAPDREVSVPGRALVVASSADDDSPEGVHDHGLALVPSVHAARGASVGHAPLGPEGRVWGPVLEVAEDDHVAVGPAPAQRALAHGHDPSQGVGRDPVEVVGAAPGVGPALVASHVALGGEGQVQGPRALGAGRRVFEGPRQGHLLSQALAEADVDHARGVGWRAAEGRAAGDDHDARRRETSEANREVRVEAAPGQGHLDVALVASLRRRESRQGEGRDASSVAGLGGRDGRGARAAAAAAAPAASQDGATEEGAAGDGWKGELHRGTPRRGLFLEVRNPLAGHKSFAPHERFPGPFSVFSRESWRETKGDRSGLNGV